MFFSEHLRELRKASGLSQIEIAKTLNIAPVTMRQYEQGKREPNIEKLLQLAMIFNVTLDNLLCFEDFKRSREESVDES